MRNSKVVLLIGLSVLAVLSLLYGILAPSPSRRGASSAPSASEPLPPSSEDFMFLERSARRSTMVGSSRNPFLAERVAIEKAGGLTLRGIVWDEQNPKAVINDRIVGSGETVAGRKVVKIEQTRVILNDGTNEVELKLGQQK